MFRRGIVLVALVAMVLGGCGLQSGKTMMSLGKGDSVPPLANADETAYYAVYPNTGANPIRRIKLQRGDTYGFIERDGKRFAVARDVEIPLESTLATGYYWKMEKN
jgi:hypothetical protein